MTGWDRQARGRLCSSPGERDAGLTWGTSSGWEIRVI